MWILLFDIDGTLIRTGGAGGNAFMDAFSTLFDVPDPIHPSFSGRTDRGLAGELFQGHGIEDSQSNWERLRDGYLERLPQTLPERVGEILPGVQQVLEELTAHPLTRLGLLTGNVEAGARCKLSHFQLEHFFSFGGYGDHHHSRNDVASAALESTREAHGDTDSDRIWVIGDTPNDIRCARHIGANVVAVATGLHPVKELEAHQPDILLDDLTQLVRKLPLSL